jgi:hypothetical protein
LKEEKHLLILAKHKAIFDLYELTGEIVNLHPHIKNEIVEAYKTEFPLYHYNPNCNACVGEMLTTIYKYYNQKINE